MRTGNRRFHYAGVATILLFVGSILCLWAQGIGRTLDFSQPLFH